MVEKGKLVDLVLWWLEFVGVKSEIVLKGGSIAWAQMGEANASIPTPEPFTMRPMFGVLGRAVGSTSAAFVSQLSLDREESQNYGVALSLVTAKNWRNLGKKDMKLIDTTPDIQVDPVTYKVTVDGEHITCESARVIPLAQRYDLF